MESLISHGTSPGRLDYLQGQQCNI